MDLSQTLPQFKSKHPHSPSSPLPDSPSAARVEQGHTVRPTGLCSALGEDPDPSNSGMDTNCSVIY